ncbi:MAG TPA: hypothetical protein VHL61_06925 [Luteimonas sp.]|nr:hypothetical protein [Luteimonas sp.]
MRTNRRLWWPVLTLCLGACAQPAPPAATPAPAVATPVATTPVSTTAVADAGLAIALARDAAARAAREQTLRVQKQLRERANADQEALRAAQQGNGNERCIAGQKMRRVANGWVQSGLC